ncbi:MAG: indole-3-glycerol-phosphate synthase [Polyangiaceae bacterium]
MSLLDDIVRTKTAEAARLRPIDAGPTTSRVDVVGNLRRTAGPARSPLRLLAEVKFKSPSAGPLSRALDAGARAVAYARGGATLVSVLCDGTWFDGDWQHVRDARLALDAAGFDDVGVLAKEFVVDVAQVRMAATTGASAVLVIVRIVDDRTLGDLVRTSRDLGLEPLVEVTDDVELGRALRAGARVVGVNARDLDTLVLDRDRAAATVASIPEACVALALSGLRSEADVAEVARGRADGALVGEILMRSDDPEPLVASFVRAANSP